MAENEKFNLTSVGKIDYIGKIVSKLMCEKILNEEEKEALLESALLLIHNYEKDITKKSYFELAYYIILKYSLSYGDYEPLYDFSFNYGFYPTIEYINKHIGKDTKTINTLALESVIPNYKRGDITETFYQKVNRDNIIESENSERCYIAPTSFGKSSIIIDIIKMDLNKKYVIVVPTKSLISQMYRNLKAEKLNIKLISFDEMYIDEESFVAVFTQERAIRLLEKVQWGYDYLFIDEAHNILYRDNRNLILSRLIKLNKERNKHCKLIYLSPLIENVNNLVLYGFDKNIQAFKIDQNIKVPELIYCDIEQKVVRIYNKFFNKYYAIGDSDNPYDYINENSSDKNLIYFYRPKIIEEFTNEFCNRMPKIKHSKDLRRLINILKKYVHKDFSIVESLSKGIIYLHGKIPDYIKDYLEFKFRELSEIKYLIANKVILEGVNLPFSSLFIMDPYNLDYNSMINLIGRINRLNSIFGDGGDLKKLLPKIHFIKSMYSKDIDITKKLECLRNTTIKDEIENPLLDSYTLENIKNEETKIKRQEDDKKIKRIEDLYFSSFKTDKEKIRHEFVSYGLQEFFEMNDELITLILKRIKYYRKHKSSEPLTRIFKIFFSKENKWIVDYDIKRLQNKSARNYYRNLILKAKTKPLKLNILSTIRNFDRQMAKGKTIIYIGKSYGEVNQFGIKSKNYNENVFINIKNFNNQQKTNLAITKIKMEEDFVSYKLNKFIELAFDNDVITEEEYNLLIFGTTDKQSVRLIKQGFPVNILGKLIKDGQVLNISFNEYNMPIGNDKFKEYFDKQDDFYKFQIDKYISII